MTDCHQIINEYQIMQVVVKDENPQVNTLKITIEKADYEPTFVAELKKYRSKAQMKGFRKGKTPLSFIKKMYGQQVMVEVVMDKINNALNNYISENDLNILGQPLANENQERYEFDPSDMGEMEFLFDVGLAPDFEVKGLDNTYDLMKVEIPETLIDEELDLARRRGGHQVEVDDNIKKDDILTISAWELTEEGGELKESGWETGFTIMVDLIADDNLREKILAGKKGIEFDFNIYELEKGKDEKYVHKYFLNLDEDEEKEIGAFFHGKVDVVKRLQPAELDQEFFDKQFGEGKASSEEEAREIIRKELENYYEGQAQQVMNREVMEKIMEETSIETPNEFLKRWLKETNENLTDENLDTEFPAFADNLKWTLIKNKLSKQHDIKVEPADIRNKMAQKVMGYMQGYPLGQDYLNDMVNRLMQNKEQVNQAYEEVQAEKIFDQLKTELATAEKSVSLDEFKEVVKKMNERLSN